jgi:hypothetical protein
MRVELNKSNDNYDRIMECAINDEFETEQVSDEAVFYEVQKVMQKNNDYYYKLGILNALDDAVLKINMVDGKPQFQILYFSGDASGSVCKTLNNGCVWTDNELSCNLTLNLKDEVVTFISERDGKSEIIQHDPR